VAWDFGTPSELRLSRGDGYADQPTERLYFGPGAGDHGRFQPRSTLPLSTDDTKVIELAGLVRAILTGQNDGPRPADAVASAEALEAMVRSAAGAGWVQV